MKTIAGMLAAAMLAGCGGGEDTGRLEQGSAAMPTCPPVAGRKALAQDVVLGAECCQVGAHHYTYVGGGEAPGCFTYSFTCDYVERFRWVDGKWVPIADIVEPVSCL